MICMEYLQSSHCSEHKVQSNTRTITKLSQGPWNREWSKDICCDQVKDGTCQVNGSSLMEGEAYPMSLFELHEKHDAIRNQK